MLLGMKAFGKFLHGFRAERFQIIGLAAGDESFVDHDFFVDPVTASVADIGLQAGKRRELAAFDHVGLDEHPRPVANGGDRFALLKKIADEIDSFRIHAKHIWIR